MPFLPQSLTILIDVVLPGPLEIEDHDCRKSDFLFVDTETVRDQL